MREPFDRGAVKGRRACPGEEAWRPPRWQRRQRQRPGALSVALAREASRAPGFGHCARRARDRVRGAPRPRQGAGRVRARVALTAQGDTRSRPPARWRNRVARTSSRGNGLPAPVGSSRVATSMLCRPLAHVAASRPLRTQPKRSERRRAVIKRAASSSSSTSTSSRTGLGSACTGSWCSRPVGCVAEDSATSSSKGCGCPAAAA